MSAFDYGTEAGLFCAQGHGFRPKALRYRRFARAADAIRFVIEDLPANVLRGCTLEVNEDTYDGDAIRDLYESRDFPLPRRVKASLGQSQKLSREAFRRTAERQAVSGAPPFARK